MLKRDLAKLQYLKRILDHKLVEFDQDENIIANTEQQEVSNVVKDRFVISLNHQLKL